MLQELRAMSRFMKRYHEMDVFDLKKCSGRQARHKAAKSAHQMMKNSQNRNAALDYLRRYNQRANKAGDKLHGVWHEGAPQKSTVEYAIEYALRLQEPEIRCCPEDKIFPKNNITRDDLIIKNYWQLVVAPIIAHNMGCRAVCYVHNGRRQVSFFGRRDNLQRCVKVFDMITFAGNTMIEEKQERDKSEGKRLNNSMAYVYPLIDEICRKMEENSKRLKIVIPKEVDERMHKDFPANA